MNWFKYVSVGLEIVTEILKASSEGKITIAEIITIIENVIGELGIKLDKTQQAQS